MKARALVLFILLATILAGCEEDIGPAPRPKKRPVDVEEVAPVPVAPPKKKRPDYIRLDVPIMYPNPGYVALIQVPERGTVLKIKSTTDTSNGQVPAYYFHAMVEADNLKDLFGQDIGVTAFVHEDKTSGIWEDVQNEPVLLRLQAENDIFRIKIVGGRMVNALTKEVLDVTGEFVCVESSK